MIPIVFDAFTNGAGRKIRWGHASPPAGARATLVILPGFREPIEKYFEVMAEKLAQGFDIFAMDWPGQGGSDRFLPSHPMKSHHMGYAECVDTLDQFMKTIMEKNRGRPVFLLAHSMGGHIALRFLAERENSVAGAVLSAPMIDIETGMPGGIARFIAAGAEILGLRARYVPGGDWTPDGDVFPGGDKTSDPARFRVQPDLYGKNPDLRMGGATFGWVYQTLASARILGRADYLRRITTPILMGIPGRERIVKRAALERAASLLPACTRVDIPDALHEIWMECDELRDRWRTNVDAFLERLISKG